MKTRMMTVTANSVHVRIAGWLAAWLAGWMCGYIACVVLASVFLCMYSAHCVPDAAKSTVHGVQGAG
jgi:hypothetical protein